MITLRGLLEVFLKRASCYLEKTVGLFKPSLFTLRFPRQAFLDLEVTLFK